jgi:hypothetical protein
VYNKRMTTKNTTQDEIETLRTALRAECLKVLRSEGVVYFSSCSTRDSVLTMPVDCLVNPTETKESRRVIRKIARELIRLEGREVKTGGQQSWSYATGERHAIGRIADESTRRGFLKSDYETE